MTGTAATVALDSSSVTMILLITLVDAGLLSFVEALPVILGSNIGTTISSPVFALNIDEYAPVLLLAEFLARAPQVGSGAGLEHHRVQHRPHPLRAACYWRGRRASQRSSAHHRLA
ncbi:Na/Pi symporter [Microvirga tunisiensis]|uniref:Na/Pi symporter n=1 Tax=Microvirga tunisiensis TaxID=2108360 RepID=UPI003CC7F300